MRLTFPDWEEDSAREFDPIRRWAFKTVAKVSQAEYQRIMAGRSGIAAPGGSSRDDGPLPPPPPDPMLGEIERALTRKGQVILYGPPGTGKTYNARRFAVWWLARRRGEADADRLLIDRARFKATEDSLSAESARSSPTPLVPGRRPRVWWLVANPSMWSWDHLFAEGRIDYNHGRLERNYPEVTAGDLFVSYESSPTRRLVVLGRIAQGLHDTAAGPRITIEPIARLSNGPSYEELSRDHLLSTSEPIRFNNQGTLFALNETEAERMLSLVRERDPGARADAPAVAAGAARRPVLTRVTFHPSYSHEDFVEGFKPQPTDSGRLDLRLTDGVFKRSAALPRPI